VRAPRTRSASRLGADKETRSLAIASVFLRANGRHGVSFQLPSDRPNSRGAAMLPIETTMRTCCPALARQRGTAVSPAGCPRPQPPAQLLLQTLLFLASPTLARDRDGREGKLLGPPEALRAARGPGVPPRPPRRRQPLLLDHLPQHRHLGALAAGAEATPPHHLPLRQGSVGSRSPSQIPRARFARFRSFNLLSVLKPFACCLFSPRAQPPVLSHVRAIDSAFCRRCFVLAKD
jgi:hypothetical protein